MKEFNELYKEYSNGIYKYLYYLTGNKDELSVIDDELENYIQEGYASYKGAYGNYEMEINYY